MSKRQPHAALVQEVLYRLRAAGWFAVPIQQQARCVKGRYFRGGLYPGIADVLAWREGNYVRSLAVECKHGSDKLKPDQLRFKRDFEAHGGNFVECRIPEDDLEDWL